MLLRLPNPHARTLRTSSARPCCQDLFGLGSIEELFAIKDQQSFAAFERGELSEAENFATYFTDRRPVDGRLIQDYLSSRYEWLPGVRAWSHGCLATAQARLLCLLRV